MVGAVTRSIDRIRRIGSDPRDDDELARRKQFLVGVSVAIMPIAVVFTALYLAFGQPLAAAVPGSYAALSLVGIAVFARTRRFGLFRTWELTLTLILPFALHVSLGGFVRSSAVVLWSLIAPLGALVYDDVRAAYRWFVAYVVILLVAFAFQDVVPLPPALPAAVLNAFFVLNLAGLSAVGFIELSQFVRQLDYERGRSEGLLLNVLPKPIADRLKREPGIIADRYSEATILFADVVNSTPLSVELSPEALVTLLDEYIGAFDGLAERHGVEKIRTIGDNWMGVAGVPRRRPDHARCAALLALEMLAFAEERHRRGGRALDFRIGLNSGPWSAASSDAASSSSTSGATR